MRQRNSWLGAVVSANALLIEWPQIWRAEASKVSIRCW